MIMAQTLIMPQLHKFPSVANKIVRISITKRFISKEQRVLFHRMLHFIYFFISSRHYLFRHLKLKKSNITRFTDSIPLCFIDFYKSLVFFISVLIFNFSLLCYNDRSRIRSPSQTVIVV